MTAHYSIVQYVPDPIADERMNIGVIVIGDGEARCEFVRDWRRAQRFGNESIEYLKQFAHSVIQTRLLPDTQTLSLDTLCELSERWTRSIQFTTPSGSVLSPDVLLKLIATDSLKQPVRSESISKDKRAIVRKAEEILGSELERRFHTKAARKLVTHHYDYQGAVDEHRLDVAVRNGNVFLAAFAISFDRTQIEALHNRIRIAGWGLSDLQEKDKTITRAVIVSPPSESSESYGEAIGLYHQTERIAQLKGAHFLPELDLPEFASDFVKRVPAAALEHAFSS